MLKSSIKEIKGIGDYYSKVLMQNGIRTCADLLWLFPKSQTSLEVTKSPSVGKAVALNLTIQSVIVKNGTRKITALKCNSIDGQEISINFFSHSKLFYKGSKICVCGEVKFEYSKYNMTHPKWVYGHLDEFQENSYIIDKVPPAIIKKSILTVIKSLSPDLEWIPKEFILQHSWPGFVRSFEIIHSSTDSILVEKAKERLRFEEALSYLLGLHLAQINSIKHADNYKLMNLDLDDIIQQFGFKLTDCQQKAWDSIKNDLISKKQMLRILYGDVGSGKTLIAAMALILTYRSNRQGLFLVPTELLAKQHYEFLKRLSPETNIILLTSSTKKKNTYTKIKDEICIIVATHAALQSSVEYNNLGLLVIDEQHRFGVLQRMAIDVNLCYNVLLMTATPIPRTLQLSLNNSIDVSTILTRPQMHRNINVMLDYKTENIIEQMKLFLNTNQNIFWVCPLIEKSETRKIMDLSTRAEYLKNIFGDLVGFVHGKMPSASKDEILLKFYRNEIRILVSTTVIEVGINIPHANMMVIENPEFFGLAQLYQLIGRVGRGSEPGFCYLLHGFLSKEARERLKALQVCKTGLELAQHDMYLRGAGNILGIEQSGETYFHLLDLNRDYDILKQAQDILKLLLQDQNFDKSLLMDVFAYLYSPWSGG